MRVSYISILFVLLTISVLACKKSDGSKVDNPYTNIKPPPVDPNADSTADPASIQGLHRDLFKPTCSNSGCHDGTFEPDFRTVQSTYNSLVNQKPIKNDLAGTFSARVVPGSADGSILIYRMTVDLGGNSGIMPLVLDPGSTYPTKKDQHIANIRKWINDGAKDFEGKAPVPADFPPTILGVQALAGSNFLPRGGKYEPFYTYPGANIDLWFSLSDDHTAQGSLTGMTINWSTDPGNFDPGNEKPLIQGTKTMAGLYNASTDYGWYYTFSTSGLVKDDVIWFRITCSDGSNQNYQLPNTNSMFFLKKYFAIRIL
ncbi:MAG: hypothetical protein KG003_03210 [Bacteroidetes bacterium]|nr:hypothetical protein [Bacteroidota bacterium]